MNKIIVRAEPHDFEFEPRAAGLLIIDMQNDFVKEGGLGDLKGHDISPLKKAIPPLRKVLDAVRGTEIKVIYTRQGYRPDLSDFPFRGRSMDTKGDIGTEGPMGRILVKGHKGHEIIDELKPMEGEVIVDKPGHGAFYSTDLQLILRNWGTRYLLITGVTTDVCVSSTVREASDRGYESLVLEDCVASYTPKFHEACLDMVRAQNGLFGKVAASGSFIKSIHELK